MNAGPSQLFRLGSRSFPSAPRSVFRSNICQYIGTSTRPSCCPSNGREISYSSARKIATSSSARQPQNLSHIRAPAFATKANDLHGPNGSPNPISRPLQWAFVKRRGTVRWSSDHNSPPPSDPLTEKPAPLEEPEELENEGLDQPKLEAIFDEAIEEATGVKILSELQEQRRAGRLDELLDYPPHLIVKGLEWLRHKYPIDEDAAIIKRVDAELDGEWNLPQTNTKRSRSADSSLEMIRKINVEKYEAQKAQREAERKELEERQLQEMIDADSPKDVVSSTRREVAVSKYDDYVHREGRTNPMAPWKARHWDEATVQTLPRMTKFERIWPSAVFTAGTICVALAFAYFYTPFPSGFRLIPVLPPAAAAVAPLIVMNILVTAAWQRATLWKTMNKFFLIVPAIPRAFQMIGAGFSQQELKHLFANMLGLLVIGTRLHDDIGRGPFLALVACGCVIPAFTGLATYVMKRIFISSIAGASGMVCSLIGCTCVLYEGTIIHLRFFPEESRKETDQIINTGPILVFLMVLELVYLRRFGLTPTHLINTGKASVDHLGHLVGYVTGAVAGWWICKIDPHWKNVKREAFYRPGREADGDQKGQRRPQKAKGKAKQPPVVVVDPRTRANGGKQDGA